MVDRNNWQNFKNCGQEYLVEPLKWWTGILDRTVQERKNDDCIWQNIKKQCRHKLIDIFVEPLE